jgi:hypothetical protein
MACGISGNWIDDTVGSRFSQGETLTQAAFFGNGAWSEAAYRCGITLETAFPLLLNEPFQSKNSSKHQP